MITPAEQIEDFVARFHYTPNKVGRPLWIKVRIEAAQGHGVLCTYDFKLDDARRAFGALCHSLHLVGEMENRNA